MRNMTRYLCVLFGLIAFTLIGCKSQKNNEGDAYQGDKAAEDKTITNNDIPVITEVKPVLDMYLKVINNETKLYFGNAGSIYLRDVWSKVFSGNPDINVEEFTLIDMDGNGIPEFVFNLNIVYDGFTFILHYFNGAVYGDIYGYREMQGLKKDGTFYWSNSAANSGIGKRQFSGGKAEFIKMAEADEREAKGIYRINNSVVTEIDFFVFVAMHDEKERAEWYDFTFDNLSNLEELYNEQP